MTYILALFILIPSLSGFAAEGGKVIDDPVKKADNRYRDRWTLADWFETQRKVRLQDQWLSVRMTSNPYEFYLGGDTAGFDRLNRTTDLTDTFRVTRGYLGAFASIVGLEGQYISTDEKSKGWNGLFHLRVFGTSVQSSNITLQYGLKNRDETIETTRYEYQIQFAGIAVDLYITQFFGIGGLYRKYFENSDKQNLRVGGERVEGTAFIDYSFLRIYGRYFNEPTWYDNLVVRTKYESIGFLVGGTLFF